jgi:flagellin-like hook-associated protein FlgL
LYFPGLAFSSFNSSFMLVAGTDGLTENISGAAATSITGVKLLNGSNGTFVFTIGAMTKSWTTSTIVCPSAGARATVAVPTAPPAPGRFSTMNDPPSFSESFSARTRAVKSAGPPAG